MRDDSYQEKTEPASEHKREEARRKGRIPRSAELNSAFVLLFGLLILYVGGGALVNGLASIARSTFASAGSLRVTPDSLHGLVGSGMANLGILLAPVILGVMIVGLASSYSQVGFVFSAEPFKTGFARMNPLEGIKRILGSRRSLMELFKSLVKIIVVGLAAYSAVEGVLLEAPTLVESEPSGLLGYIGQSAFGLGIRMGLAFLVLAVVDFFFQRYEHERDLRMTRQEVKEEMKTMEGDPTVKGRVRTIQRRIAYRRMMQDVPKADVVVANPTHLAIALRYDAEEMNAPKVVAKGADLLALKIREIATAHNVPIVEDKPLAQALYKSVEVGQEVPEKLFQAVAQLLAYIYRLKQTSHAFAMN